MLKNMLNEVRLTYNIKATGPILIKKGETEKEVKKRKESDRHNSPDMLFVVDANKDVFIPGSSIRGVWRSWCEKIARTISNGVPLACDPFNDNDKDKNNINLSCSKRLEITEISTSAYAESCPICKLFGNTSIASRIRISDAYPIDVNSGELLDVDRRELPVRDGIGIDRFTGGTSNGAKFRYQYLIGETFKADVQIRNFELWQLGLLGFLFRDFEEELVPIGFGKTKGLGKVKGTLKKAELIFYGFNKPDVVNNKAQIKGIGDLYHDNDKDSYCFDIGKSLENIDINSTSDKTIKTTLELNGEQAKDLFNKTANFWATLKDGVPDGYFLEAQKRRNQIMEGT